MLLDLTLFDEKCRVQRVVDGTTPSQNLVNIQANLQVTIYYSNQNYS